MKPRFTPSNDGVERSDWRIKHRLKRQDLINILVHHIALRGVHIQGVWYHTVTEQSRDLRPKQILDMIRDELFYEGMSATMIPEDVVDENIITKWCECQINNVFGDN